MRINLFLAQATGLSRRAADRAIIAGKVSVNGQVANLGQAIIETDVVSFDGKPLKKADVPPVVIMMNKPVSYVVSRTGQGSKTIYELLPPEYQHLKPVGRLDKNSSGLLLLTNDGTLAHQLTHPSFQKMKCYEIELNKPLSPTHWTEIAKTGVTLEDGPSTFELHRIAKNNGRQWLVTMHEGRNRQIRRTFAALGYTVTRLHRIQFGSYSLGPLKSADYQIT